MSPKVDSLRRLRTLCGILEKQAFEELQRSTAEVNKAVQAIAAQTDLVRTSFFEEHGAIVVGNRGEAVFSAALRDIAIRRRSSLERILREREERREAARERYLASRMKQEKVEILLDIAESQAKVERERKEQMSTNDGFLLRKRWNQKRDSWGAS